MIFNVHFRTETKMDISLNSSEQVSKKIFKKAAVQGRLTNLSDLTKSFI